MPRYLGAPRFIHTTYSHCIGQKLERKWKWAHTFHWTLFASSLLAKLALIGFFSSQENIGTEPSSCTYSKLWFFSCPEQLNRWPSDWLTQWLTQSLADLYLWHTKSDPWDYDHKHDHDHDQVLVERVRQTAWEMHYAKTDSIIYLFRWPIKRLMYFHSQFIHTWSSYQ